MVSSVLSIFIGGMIYILCRENSLLMFQWIDNLCGYSLLIPIRSSLEPMRNILPSWLIYSFPGGLWIFSSVVLFGSIWHSEKRYLYYFWILLLPIIALISEAGQFINVIPGTYCHFDIFMYVFMFFVGYGLCQKYKQRRML
jgi:hypothetical protein